MSLEQKLSQRCQSKCELCSATNNISIYRLPPVTDESAEKAVMVCEKCLSLIQDSSRTDEHHWRCLSESMWSEHPAVQVLSWRLLKRLEQNPWAQDLLNQLYLDEETQKWAESISSDDNNANDDTTPTKDSNGTILKDGDSVTLIKDLEVKGANFTAKRGTLVKNISLTSNPAHIEGRVNGTQIVLLTCFLKKAN